MPLITAGTNDLYTYALRTRSLGFTTTSIPSASYALSMDVSAGGDFAVTMQSTNTVASWTITGATDLQRTLFAIYKAGSQTLVWPTNFRWTNNAAPTLGGTNTWNFVEMIYFNSNGRWHELSRSMGVPGA